MKNRGIAIILCFFLGAFGVHRMYLGQVTVGVMYLLFFWTGIPFLLAFIDFFVLLFTEDREFDRKFNGTNALINKIHSAADTTSALAELKNLYDMGAITAEEYEQKRRRLLDRL
jgi:TM2 domain-containing membrane protein YozV